MTGREAVLRERAAEIHTRQDELDAAAVAREGDQKGVFTDAERKEYEGNTGKLEAIGKDLEQIAKTRKAENEAWGERRGVRPGELADGKAARVDDGARIAVGEDLTAKAPFGYQGTPRSDREKRLMQQHAFGEFMQAVAAAGTGRNGESYGKFKCGTVDPRLIPHGTAAGITTGDPTAAGFLVTKDHSNFLIDRAREAAVLFPRCTEIPVGPDSDGIEAPYIDETSRATGSRWGGVQVYRRSEVQAGTLAQPKIGKWEVELAEMIGLAKASYRSLRDATSLGAILENSFQSEMAFKIDDEIVRGTGAGQCLGMLNAGCLVTQAAETQSADTVVAANVQKMYSRMLPRLVGGAVWLINSEIWPQLFAFNQANMPVFMPGISMAGSPFGTLLGRPILAIEQCSAIGDVGDILFVNLSEYVVATKGSVDAAESMHVYFTTGENAFRWIWRVNGQPKAKTAVTPYKGANSQSAFVALSASGR